jgi:hypothetical protein
MDKTNIIMRDKKHRRFVLSSCWFETDYLYRVEEGEKEYSPSKIEAVRKDDKDFDDLSMMKLKLRLESSIFPKSVYRLYFESDEFRKFVRIYVDSVRNKIAKKTHEVDLKIIVPVEEIEKRIRESESIKAEEKKSIEFARVVEVRDAAKSNQKEGGSLSSSTLETSDPIVVVN